MGGLRCAYGCWGRDGLAALRRGHIGWKGSVARGRLRTRESDFFSSSGHLGEVELLIAAPDGARTTPALERFRRPIPGGGEEVRAGAR